jgi:protein TonB
MFATLLESRHQHTRRLHMHGVSVVVHTVLIAAAIAATQQAARVLEPVVAEPVTYVRPMEAIAQPTTSLFATRLPGFLSLTSPIRIPDVLPTIDLSSNVPTNPDDYLRAVGQPGGDPRGSAVVNGPMTADQVDRAAHLLAGSGRPVYPEALRSVGLAGEVVVQFVIDSVGRADMRTLSIISSTNDRFTESVRRALEKARFAPAEFGGRKVAQVVRMPFVFSLTR